MSIKSYIDRYFNLLVDPMFQRDEQGRELYFPMGIGSRGRIVPDAATGERIRLVLRRAWMVLFAILLLPQITLPFYFDAIPPGLAHSMISSVWFLLVPVAIVLALQFSLTRYLCRGFEASDRRMTIRNQSASIAAKYSMSFITVMLVVSAILSALCGIAYVAPATVHLGPNLPGWIDQVVGVGGTVFFAVATALWGRAALEKRRRIAS